jgi:hypothetical protein
VREDAGEKVPDSLAALGSEMCPAHPSVRNLVPEEAAHNLHDAGGSRMLKRRDEELGVDGLSNAAERDDLVQQRVASPEAGPDRGMIMRRL